MTIASEITALQNNLASAKAAVTAKGGTVGDTGLAGLASEIATIPSGGSVSWGTVIYDNGSGETEGTIQNANEFMSLCHDGNGSAIATINNVSVPFNNIKEVELTSIIYCLPDHFLRNAGTLRKLSGTSGVIAIGNYCLAGSGIRNDLDFENTVSIGDCFLNSCSSFNNNLKLSKLEKIGGNFMQLASSFAQQLTLPSTLTTVGSNFMYRCNNFVGPLVCNAPSSDSGLYSNNYSLGSNSSSAKCYTTGITLTGTYASVWKNRYPDRTSQPYRKLILGS